MSIKKKILVTGGAGYIGSHTIIELLADPSLEIISADNFMRSTAKTFDRIKKITGKSIINHQVDLCDLNATEELFKKEKNIAAIIHFAALKSVPGSVKEPELYHHNNLESLKNILTCCVKYDVRQLIFSSSCSVYGNIEKLPVNEQTPLGKAQSPYAETKLLSENILKEFAKKNALIKCVSLRYFNPVGAHLSGLIGEIQFPKENLVPVITAVAIGQLKEVVVSGNDHPTRDGTCIRDYIHVVDIAIAHVKALGFLEKENSSKNYFVFNLGSGKGVSVKEAIDAFEKASGQKLNYRIGPRRTGDPHAIYSDCSLAEKELGWKPKYSIDEMMSSAWIWERNLAAQE